MFVYMVNITAGTIFCCLLRVKAVNRDVLESVEYNKILVNPL